MPRTSRLSVRLAADYPQFAFVRDETDRWSPTAATVYYSGTDESVLLHELAHALLGHTCFTQDVELIGMERAAWQYAKTVLAPRYAVGVTDSLVEDALDTYRDWLHLRSLCPDCELNGLQRLDGAYVCPFCARTWTANDGRACQLRRYRTPRPVTSR